MEYLQYILILICIYIILSTSLNLIAGYTGLISISHAAFYGVGAYTAGLMALYGHTPFYLNILVAVIFCGMLGVLVGLPSLRIRGDYFVITTFAFQVLVFNILNNWTSLTGGPLGLPGIPQPDIVGWHISTQTEFLALGVVFCALTLWTSRRIIISPYGRVLIGIREDEVFTESMGKNVAVYKISIFAIGAGMAALAGALYATYITYIDPSSFNVMESIFILSIVIIGGAGSQWGPIVGAVLMVILPEILRFLGLPGAVAANIRQILYGSLLVAFMLMRPQGLLGKYTFAVKGVKQ